MLSSGKIFINIYVFDLFIKRRHLEQSMESSNVVFFCRRYYHVQNEVISTFENIRRNKSDDDSTSAQTIKLQKRTIVLSQISLLCNIVSRHVRFMECCSLSRRLILSPSVPAHREIGCRAQVWLIRHHIGSDGQCGRLGVRFHLVVVVACCYETQHLPLPTRFVLAVI